MDENQQPEALELAEILESDLCDYPLDEAAAELRRQHARIAELEAELEAVGAGGVGPLRKRDDSMVRKADVIARLEQGFGAGSAVVMTIKHFFSNELPRQEHATQLAGQGQDGRQEPVANVTVTQQSSKQMRVEYNWLDHDWQPGEYELFAARAAQGGAA